MSDSKPRFHDLRICNEYHSSKYNAATFSFQDYSIATPDGERPKVFPSMAGGLENSALALRGPERKKNGETAVVCCTPCNLWLRGLVVDV
jgi:hypothetical protein